MSAADREQAAADLAALDADRAALADRVVPPWWSGPTLGLLLFLFVSSYALDSLWVTFPALVLFGAGLGALTSRYRATTGVWVRMPLRTLLGWGAFVVVVLGPAFYAAEAHGQRWAMVVAGAVLGLAVALLSRHWTRAWQRELREGV